MKKIIILIILILSISFISSSCDLLETKQYELKDISKEKTDLDHINSNDNLRVFFSVYNRGDLTLNSKIEVELNDECFDEVPSKELGDIPPKQSIRSFITIELGWRIPDECIEKSHNIKILLKDVNGKELDSNIISVGII